MRITLCGLLTIASITFLPENIKSQSNLNMILQDSLTYHTGVNDVMGWADPLGNEYALVGLNTGVSIVSIDEDPLVEVVFVPGVYNNWRDINTFGHYAYVVSEAHVGLLIIDLQYLPDSVKTYVWQDSLPTPSGNRLFTRAHTIWIDEYGIGYLNGGNLNSGGSVLIDVATNPTDPVFLGYGPRIYSHDTYSRDSILYSAEIWTGDLSIYDVHDPQNIFLIGRVKTPNEFTHNVWLSDDSRYMFTTDERPNSYVTSYDIQDPANIIELDRFRQADTDGTGNIPHNVYVWNDFLVVAYYTSGTLIVDAARPDNLIEVGSFDSFLGADGGFNGVWGSWPFLPSGKIISSDRNSGLYVFIPNYVRAAYLEGTVLDSITRAPIQGAIVTINSPEIVLPQSTGFDGVFKTGKAVPGTFDITVTKPGYYPKTITATFINGEVLTPLFELNQLPTHAISGKVVFGGIGVPFAKVLVDGHNGTYNTETDALGNFVFPSVYEGTYFIDAGIWGKTRQAEFVLDGPQNITLQLIQQYYDDFDLDLGWTVSGDAQSGHWVRGIPSLELLFDVWVCGSPTDSPHDLGNHLYSTGFAPSGDIDDNEVSGGTTWLSSPSMDLDSIGLITVSFDYWLCEYPPNQYVGFKAWMTDGTDTLLLKEYSMSEIISLVWKRETIYAWAWNGPKNNIRILFSASDTTSGFGDYRLKVHVDNFSVTEGAIATKDEKLTAKQFVIYPNPIDDNKLFLKAENGVKGNEISFNIVDVQGKIISSHRVLLSEIENGITHKLQNGIYFLQWRSDIGESGVEKIVVLKN